MNLYVTATSPIASGTQAEPTTLSDACSRAIAGDTIYLSGGTYRGTYRPASGVTLQGDGAAIISGLDVVSGFTQVGDYYTTPATKLTPLSGSMGADQVFIDGVEVLESRWPAATISTRGDISTWAECTAASHVLSASNTICEGTYTVQGLPPGDITDCEAHLLNGYQWVSIGGRVTASSTSGIPGDPNSTVTISFPFDGKDYNLPTAGSRFYLWGGIGLPHGFSISDGMLRLATDPRGSVVEIKARYYGVDLRGRSNVKIEGITLQSCSIQTSGTTTAITLDSMNIYNLMHFQAPSSYWWSPPGIRLMDGSVVKNITVEHSASSFLSLRGTGCIVDNVTVMDTTYNGACQAAIDMQGSNHTISRSTFGMAGSQGLLDMRNMTGGTFRGCEVYGGGGILTDGGSVMFADSHVTTDQGNRVLECVIHDTRGRTGPQPHLYGNAGIYLEGEASAHIKDCHIWGATSNDLQVVPLSGAPGHVVVENCTLGSLNISYSGGAASIPITYRNNIVRTMRGGTALAAATITGNHIDRERIPGNTQASNIFSTLDRGYPGPYTPPDCGARCGPLYFFGAYDRSLSYVASATRHPLTGEVKIRLDGPPPPDGFTVTQGSTTGVVRQYVTPTPHLTVSFPPTVSGVVDIVLSAPSCTSMTMTVTIPGDLRVTPSTGVAISGAGFSMDTQTEVLVSITSEEESWDIPVPIPVDGYIAQGLMEVDGTGLISKEGLSLYVDPTYPVGGVHAWVRVPYIPRGSSNLTLLLGGGSNVSSARDVFLESDLHLREEFYNKEEPEGLSVRISGGDLVLSGTTTLASKFGSVGIRLTSSYVYGSRYPTRPFSWDTYLSMAPNSAGYWQSGLGNNSFILANGGSTVTGSSNQPSTLGREFSHKLVSNIQLPNSMVWKENLTTINSRDGLPNARGIFSIMLGQVGKTIDYRFHYIRARAVPDSGVLPSTHQRLNPTPTRLWIDGVEYTSSIVTTNSDRLTLNSAPPLPVGFYDVRVALDNGEDYLLVGGYEVPDITPVPVPTPTPTPVPIPTPTPVPTPLPVSNPITTREVGFGPLSSRPPTPNPGQVYISYEGVCYAYAEGNWVPYQVVEVYTSREALPINGVWSRGTLLVKVGNTAPPSNTLPLSGGELSLEVYGWLYTSLANMLGSPPPTTNGSGMEGSSHFLLPNYRNGIISIPGGMAIGFGGWVIQQPGLDYTIEWLVVV